MKNCIDLYMCANVCGVQGRIAAKSRSAVSEVSRSSITRRRNYKKVSNFVSLRMLYLLLETCRCFEVTVTCRIATPLVVGGLLLVYMVLVSFMVLLTLIR